MSRNSIHGSLIIITNLIISIWINLKLSMILMLLKTLLEFSKGYSIINNNSSLLITYIIKSFKLHSIHWLTYTKHIWLNILFYSSLNMFILIIHQFILIIIIYSKSSWWIYPKYNQLIILILLKYLSKLVKCSIICVPIFHIYYKNAN